MTARQHLARALIFLVLLLSPIGAPLVGVVIDSVCPVDRSFVPDGVLMAGYGYTYCGISRPVEYFYQDAAMLSLMLAFKLTLLFTLLWWWLSAATGVAFVWHLGRAVTTHLAELR